MHADEPSGPVSAQELARRLGISLSRFYRTRDRLHTMMALPRPLMSGGRLTFDRPQVDAFFARNPSFRRRNMS
jgi:predicted DNA-binding transcriptional regulator AlpA